MTEQEAAERLCTLLNEIEGAGHETSWSSHNGEEGLFVGDGVWVKAPEWGDGVWEVREL